MGAEEDFRTLVDSVLSSKCEGQTIELKAAHEGTPKVYDTLSSFSNQNDGGVIIFGIDESLGFRPVGVFNPQRLQKDIADQCAEMEPAVRPTFATASMDGVVLVGAYIPGQLMGSRPVYRRTAGITKGTYVRVGDADAKMNANELYEIEAFKSGARDDVSTSSVSTHEMLDSNLVSFFVSKAAEERPHMAHRSVEEVLSLVGAERNGVPTLAGMMTLSAYPQQAYPNLCITAIAVAGNSIGRGEEGERFLDNKRYEGPISQMVEDAMAFVRRNTKTRVVIAAGHRTDEPEYPENAVREVIINSLMHRDYGPYCNGTPTRIVIFGDRLECWNPGGIYGGQNVEDLVYTNVQTRNPTLVSMLEIQGFAENRHSGIPVIRDEMRHAGLRPPVFLDERGSFTATLYNAPEAAPSYREGGRGRITEAEVVKYCSIPRSRSEVADHFGASSVYVSHEYLNPLVEQGRLTLTLPDVPRSKNQRFVAARRG